MNLSACMNLLIYVLSAAIAACFACMKCRHRYWERQGIPYIIPSIPFGNAKDCVMRRQSLGEFLTDMYNRLKNNTNIGGGGIFIGTRPIFVTTDPELVKNMLLVDFEHFYDRGLFKNEKCDVLTGHLFNLTGSRWRNTRKKLSPMFTPNKMKSMFQTLVDCSNDLEKAIENGDKEKIDIKDVAGRFANDVVASCFFGVECNSLKDPDCEFWLKGKKTFDRNNLELVRRFLKLTFPNVTRMLQFTTNSPSLIEFFTRIVTETIEFRETNNVTRKDFMDLMIQTRRAKHNGFVAPVLTFDPDNEDEETFQRRGFTIEEIIAHSFVFYVGGFESSSTTITFLLVHLTQNPDMQDKLREEVNAVLGNHNDQMNYESLSEMKYMGMCIDETLRMYPPLPILHRVCTKHYNIPGTTAAIKKGTRIMVPIRAIHMDPEYYPNPEIFDPERFSEEMKKTRRECTYLPFSEGHRACPAKRWGIMQVKVAMTVLIKNYRFYLNEKTKLPIEMDPCHLLICARDTVWITAERIK